MLDDSNKPVLDPSSSECKGLFAEFPPATYEDWHKEAVASLKGAPFEKKVITKTYEEIELQPMYWAKDVEGIGHISTLPGFVPFVRGTTVGGSVLKPWDICQEIACSTPEEFNKAALHDLARGQNALKLVLDHPSRNGIDPDQEDSARVGQRGLSLTTLEDLNVTLHGIDLQNIPLTIYAGASALPMVALVSAYLDSLGLPASILHGCIGADPLGELAAGGAIPVSLKTAYDSMANLVLWTRENAPGMQTVLVHGSPYHDAGANAVQEVAYAVSTGAEYLRRMIERAVPIDDAASAIRFSFSLGSNFFMEIAKLRAARLVWGQIVRAFGGSPDSQKMKIHARTSAYTKTTTDPYVNMLRNTTEAFSGAMGGVDSMHVCPFDEAIRPADEFSRRVSRNLQIILQQEAHLFHPVDAAGGSWYVEKLTDTVGRRAWEMFQSVEAKGGMAHCLFEGEPQSTVAATAEKRAKNLDVRKDIIVGVNMYPNLRETRLQVPSVDYGALSKARFARLQSHRLSIDPFLLNVRLGEFNVEFRNVSREILPKSKEAVVAGATMGDLWAVLSNIEDDKPFARPLRIHRASELFEDLRYGAENIPAENGGRPKVFLAAVGLLTSFKPRADFSKAFFEVGGFDVIGNSAYGNANEAVEAFSASGARIAAICAADQAYPELIPGLAGSLKRAAPDARVLVAGKPAPEQEQIYRQAGVDDFFFAGVNCREFLCVLQERS